VVESLSRSLFWIEAAAMALSDLAGPAIDADLAASLCGRAAICARTLSRLQRRFQAAGFEAIETQERLIEDRPPIEHAAQALERAAAELAAVQASNQFNTATAEAFAGVAAIILGMRRDLAGAARGRFTLASERN
jgi:hypothetical protein